MEVYQDLACIAFSQPMRLCATWQGYAVWGELMLLSILDVVCGCRASVQVTAMDDIKAGQVGAEGGKHDILEVRVGAIVAFEGRG